MRVELEIGFSFKRELPAGFHSLDLPDGTDVESAFRHLSRLQPTLKERLFDREGRVRREINALVNGGNVARRRGFRTVLRDGDRLTILPPVGGG